MQTLVYTVIPQLVVVGVYMFLVRNQPEARITTVRNPMFVACILVAVIVWLVGQQFVGK